MTSRPSASIAALARHTPGALSLGLALTLLTLLVWLGAACAPPRKTAIPGDPKDLQFSVGVFHKELRWGRFEQASKFVADDHVQTFLGRYEELGPDYRITDLTVKQVEFEDGDAIVEVEQQWYSEATMVLRTERMVELWRPDDFGQWVVYERSSREEYRARRKQERLEAQAAQAAQAPEPTPESEPEPEPEPSAPEAPLPAEPSPSMDALPTPAAVPEPPAPPAPAAPQTAPSAPSAPASSASPAPNPVVAPATTALPAEAIKPSPDSPPFVPIGEPDEEAPE